MTSVVDVWRAVDPDARLVSGDPDRLTRPLRGVIRTRAAAPHLPAALDGELLVVDGSLVREERLDPLLRAVAEARLNPQALLVGGVERAAALERAGDEIPVLASPRPAAGLVDAARTYLEREGDHLASLIVELRLAGAEAALADPDPAAPAGVVAARLRRGVAVAIDGRLRALHARPAGQALAAGFAAAHARLLGGASDRAGARQTRDGLWLLARSLGARGTAWLFDDVPFARVDEAGLDALVITLRALLRRPERSAAATPRRQPPSTGDLQRDTLLAVARANGRVATAARALGVHRNTVLYRLRRARAELGIDPRRPEDALRIMRDAQPTD